MACNDPFTVLKRFQRRSLLVGDPRSGHGQSRPSPDAGEWRSDGRAELDGAERTYCRRVRAMPAFVLAGDRLSRRPCGYGRVLSPGSRVLHCPRQQERHGRGYTCDIWRTLRQLQAALWPCNAARASAPKEPAGVARETDHHGTLRGLDVGKRPSAGVSSGS